MAISGKALGNGTLSTTSLTTLYTVGGGLTAYIKKVSFQIDTALSGTVNLALYKNTDGSNDIPLFDFELDPGDVVIWDVSETLEAADILKAQADVVDVVNWDISGGEE